MDLARFSTIFNGLRWAEAMPVKSCHIPELSLVFLFEAQFLFKGSWAVCVEREHLTFEVQAFEGRGYKVSYLSQLFWRQTLNPKP